jgi:hypothetical protein
MKIREEKMRPDRLQSALAFLKKKAWEHKIDATCIPEESEWHIAMSRTLCEMYRKLEATQRRRKGLLF